MKSPPWTLPKLAWNPIFWVVVDAPDTCDVSDVPAAATNLRWILRILHDPKYLIP